MVKYLTAASGQGAVNYMFKEGSSLHDAINLRQTFTQHTQTFTYLGAKLCTLAAKEKFRPAFIFCVKTFIFCELLFLCTLVCCIVSNLLGSNPMVLTFCIFVSLSILIAVFAANQFGLIWWPSVFWSTNNIANLYNPPIGAMS